MTDYEIYEPDYSGTTTDDWDSPHQNDFETEDLGEIVVHFVLSSSGFPPENFTDLQLPVVNPAGNLNLNALETAHGGAHSVEAMDDIDEETTEDVKELLEDLADETFDHDLGERDRTATIPRTSAHHLLPGIDAHSGGDRSLPPRSEGTGRGCCRTGRRVRCSGEQGDQRYSSTLST